MLNFYLWPCIFAPKAEKKKKDTIQFGKPICNPLGPMFQHLFINILNVNNILAFVSNLGPNDKPKKNAQSWPQVFLGPDSYCK
jgi:hypothetical protein